MVAQWVKLFPVRKVWVHWEGCLLHPPNQNVFISKCLLFEGGRVLWQRGQNSPGMETARRWTISNRGYSCIFHGACSGREKPKVRTLEWRPSGKLQLTVPVSPVFGGCFESQVCCWCLYWRYLLFHLEASLEKTFCLGSQSGTHAQISRAVSPGCWWALIWWHYHLFALSVGQFRF